MPPKLTTERSPIAFVDPGGSKPVIIFSHGAFMDKSMFAPQLDALGESYRCVTWDQRAHGETTANGPFTLWNSAQDLLDLADSLEIQRFALCGMSQGGLVSLRAALLAPERIRGLVMLASQAGGQTSESAQRITALVDDWAESGITAEGVDWLSRLILGNGVNSEPWKRKWREMNPQQLRLAVLALVSRDDLTARLGEIACDVLVVHGGADDATGLEKAHAVASGVPHLAAFTVIPGAPHAANLSHPEDVNRALKNFLHFLRPLN